MKKYIIILFFLSLIGCKKEKKKDDNSTSGNGSVSTLYETDKLSDIIKINASFNGNHIVAVRYYNTQTEYLYSSDGGENWVKLNLNRNHYLEYTISNDGIMAWSDGSNTRFYNLNTAQFEVNTPPGYYNEFYAAGNSMYCIQGTNSSAPPIVFYKQTTASKWDTLTKKGDTLGFYCGEDKDGGIAFYNRQTQYFYKHLPSSNTIEKHKLTINYSTITNGSSGNSKSMYFTFNGYNTLCAVYTGGYAMVNITSNTVTYQNGNTDFKNLFSSNVSIDIDKDQNLYIAQYNTQHKFTTSNFSILNTHVPISCNGEYNYIIDYIKPIKQGNGNTKTLSGLLIAETEIVSASISNQKLYILFKSTDISNITILQIKDRTLGSTQNMTLKNNYNAVFTSNNLILISNKDSIGVSENEGQSFAFYANNSALPFKYIRNINGTYYALAGINFTTTLGGTGFTVEKHNMAVLTSSDFKNWIIKSGTQKTDMGGNMPQIFTTNGLMTKVENLNPLGNMNLVYYKSEDFGTNWVDNTTKTIFNTELPDGNLSLIAYAGSREIKRTDYNNGMQKIKDVSYPSTYKNLPIAIQPPIVLNGKIYFVTSKDILELSL